MFRLLQRHLHVLLHSRQQYLCPLSNTYCDSLSDLTVSVSQDPGEADMSDGLFTSNVGSFAISSMSVGDTIGSASMTAGGGFISYNTALVVNSLVSATQAVIESIDLSTGLSLGSFTLNNTTPGISIYEVVPPDNNTTTNGNSQTVTFSNIFSRTQAKVQYYLHQQ